MCIWNVERPLVFYSVIDRSFSMTKKTQVNSVRNFDQNLRRKLCFFSFTVTRAVAGLNGHLLNRDQSCVRLAYVYNVKSVKLLNCCNNYVLATGVLSKARLPVLATSPFLKSPIANISKAARPNLTWPSLLSDTTCGVYCWRHTLGMFWFEILARSPPAPYVVCSWPRSLFKSRHAFLRPKWFSVTCIW